MKTNKNLLQFIAYILLFGLWSLLLLTVYAVGQQVLRQSANDPQIQIAEDGAAYLSQGGLATDFDNPSKIDISKSLTPFLIIYDLQGKPLASSAQLGGQMPLIPLGVLETSTASGENRVTWQPKTNLRFALVVHSVSGHNAGYIAVGRSIREVEIREDNLFKISALAWLAGLILLILLALARRLSQRV